MLRDWSVIGRPEQRAPEGDWRTWLVMGGRGSGKTRAGAEWVHGLASADRRSDLRIALVAETLGDAREVMIDGTSGICRIARRNRPDFEISRRRLIWPNGAIAQIFSSEDPEALRGPQFHFAWCDELGKWKHAEDTFDMLQFGLRLGKAPRQLVTTTPRPIPLIKRLISDAATRLVRIATADNATNLAPGFVSALQRRYGGTRLGRQELQGELIEDRTDALWKRADLEAVVMPFSGRFCGPLRRIVVAVDPPSGSGEQSCCGIVVAGIEAGGGHGSARPAATMAEAKASGSGTERHASRGVVLADCSVEGMSPAGWAQAVVNAYRRFGADRVVAEVNQGGEMVVAMLKSVDANLPVTMVRASRGKFSRAEPVAALYEQGRVAHAGRFTALEDQMCDFGPDGLSSGRSPDRLDALVWALTALMLETQGEPRVRTI
ncbi:MAG: terminase family protein [Neorhizobium sp.]|nr:terminase family protein [Neorhizobium sp.]